MLSITSQQHALPIAFSEISMLLFSNDPAHPLNLKLNGLFQNGFDYAGSLVDLSACVCISCCIGEPSVCARPAFSRGVGPTPLSPNT